MKKLEALIWDLDGTLFDSYGSIVSSLLETAEACGAADSGESILKAVKRGSVSGYLRALSEKQGWDYETLYRMYRQVSHARMDEITLIPGAVETLRALRDAGARHFVYTHRGGSTFPILRRLGLEGFFEEIVTFEKGFAPKPSGEGVAYLLEKYALNPALTAYVGDRALDVLCARDAGVQAILFLPEDSCVIPTGKEHRIIRKLTELAENTGDCGRSIPVQERQTSWEAKMKTIYLAGGCFWGVQKFFDQFEGVTATEVGYANGPDQAPSYQDVCASSGHAETVKITYDPARISLSTLLDHYFMVIDPLSVNQQGHDKGIQYRTGIYYTEETQRPEIEAAMKTQREKAGADLAVETGKIRNFFPAEEYHQKYLDKNPGGYCHIPRNMFRLGQKKETKNPE